MERCIVACHNAKLALLPAIYPRCRYCLRKPQGFLYAEPEIDRGWVVCGLAIYPEGGKLTAELRGEYHFSRERIFVLKIRQSEDGENSPGDCLTLRSGQVSSGTGGKDNGAKSTDFLHGKSPRLLSKPCPSRLRCADVAQFRLSVPMRHRFSLWRVS